MKIVKYIIITLCMTILSSSLFSREVRSLWAMPWNIKNAAQIDELVADAVANNQTEILAEVRYRADALYIPNKTSDLYNNPEPRSNILADNDFDPLGYLLEKAHASGLEVQAWMVALNATSTSYKQIQSNYIYQNHRDWILTDIYGNRMDSNNSMGYFVDPGIPEVKSHLMNVILDVVQNYPDLDGIHLDYIRYPAKKYGYAHESVERFNEYKKTKPIEWNDWRALQITDFLRDLRERVLLVNPDIMLTAAVISDVDEAKVHYGQDWVEWLKEGIIDRAYPMAYAKGYNFFSNTVNLIGAMAPKDKVVVGLRAWVDNPRYESYSVQSIIEKARLCRQMGFGGIALFSYEGVKKLGYFPQLTTALYNWIEPEPVAIQEEDLIADIIESLNKKTAVTDTVSVDMHTGRSLEIMENISLDRDSVATTNYCENITLNKDKYTLSFFFNVEDSWKWLIMDEDNNVVFQKQKTYPRGLVLEEWDGVSEQGRVISPGIYTLILNNAEDTESSEKKFIIY